jgi:catechol 2,3-dioxygenase-like lactoylglutathione lyase family enzyme
MGHAALTCVSSLIGRPGPPIVRPMRIQLTNVYVDDQAKALSFYTDKLGFVKKHDVPVGQDRWLTVVSPQEPGGIELLLEPSDHPAVGPYRSALVADGIPAAQFTVDDVHKEFERLSGLGVRFTQEPQETGPIATAVLDDTCGNLIQLIHTKSE